MLGTCLFVETSFCIECFCMKHAYVQYIQYVRTYLHAVSTQHSLVTWMVLLKDIHCLHLCMYIPMYVRM